MKDQFQQHVWVTAWVHVSFSILLIVLGVAAASLWAWWSWFVTPIWMALAIFGVTGLLGLLAAYKKDLCLTNAYVGMSSVSVFAAAALVIMYGLAIDQDSNEPELDLCQPAGKLSFQFFCGKSRAATLAMNSLIAVTALLEFVLAIMSACFASYYAGQPCCAQGDQDCEACLCCQVPTPTQRQQPPVVYANPGQQMQGVPQGGVVVYQGGGGQPVQYVVQPARRQGFQQQELAPATMPPPQQQLQPPPMGAAPGYSGPSSGGQPTVNPGYVEDQFIMKS